MLQTGTYVNKGLKEVRTWAYLPRKSHLSSTQKHRHFPNMYIYVCTTQSQWYRKNAHSSRCLQACLSEPLVFFFIEGTVFFFFFFFFFFFWFLFFLIFFFFYFFFVPSFFFFFFFFGSDMHAHTNSNTNTLNIGAQRIRVSTFVQKKRRHVCCELTLANQQPR